MENSTLDNDFNTDTEMRLDDNSRAFLKETSKWAKFLAIVGFIMTGLLILLGLFMGTIFSAFGSEMAGAADFPIWTMSVMYILIALVYFMPTLYLYRFATKVQLALKQEDQFVLSSSFENLKSCFKFVGIMAIVTLAIYALAIVGGIIVGTMAS